MTAPVEISFTLPETPHSILHGHLTSNEGYAIIHLTTSDLGDSGSITAPLGSFVYAMPDRLNDKNIISTALCTTGSSIDYATRLSKILARRMNKPVYVGCSMNFAGITSEEEMHGLSLVVDQIMTWFSATELSDAN